jgi:hypothetical protein
MKRICIIGISGKLGQYMTGHALARGYEVRGVCRPQSVGKLSRFGDRITVVPGRTDDPAVIAEAVQGCDGVLTVLAPWGVRGYATGTAQAVLDHAAPGARLVFSTGWHVSRDGRDRYGWKIRAIERFGGPVLRWLGLVDLTDQHEAARHVFESSRDWTVVRGSDLGEGPSEGLPIWAERAHDPRLSRNRMRRTDFALFMVHALTDPDLVRQAPAITGAPATVMAPQTA